MAKELPPATTITLTPAFKLVFFTVLGLTILSLGVSLTLVILPNPSEEAKRLGETCSTIFKLGCGTIFGLIGGRLCNRAGFLRPRTSVTLASGGASWLRRRSVPESHTLTLRARALPSPECISGDGLYSYWSARTTWSRAARRAGSEAASRAIPRATTTQPPT